MNDCPGNGKLHAPAECPVPHRFMISLRHRSVCAPHSHRPLTLRGAGAVAAGGLALGQVWADGAASCLSADGAAGRQTWVRPQTWLQPNLSHRMRSPRLCVTSPLPSHPGAVQGRVPPGQARDQPALSRRLVFAGTAVPLSWNSHPISPARIMSFYLN